MLYPYMKQKKSQNNTYSKITFKKNVHMYIYIMHRKISEKEANLAVIISDREMELGEVVREDFHFKF